MSTVCPGSTGLPRSWRRSACSCCTCFRPPPDCAPRVQGFVAQLQSGVQVFFVISGFVIARPFVVAVLDGRRCPSFRRYAGRRFIRIFPAYWFALIGAAVFFDAPLSGWRDWLTAPPLAPGVLVVPVQPRDQHRMDVERRGLLLRAPAVRVPRGRTIGAAHWTASGAGSSRWSHSSWQVALPWIDRGEWEAACRRSGFRSSFPVFVVGTLMCVGAEVALRNDRWRSRLDRVGTCFLFGGLPCAREPPRGGASFRRDGHLPRSAPARPRGSLRARGRVRSAPGCLGFERSGPPADGC